MQLTNVTNSDNLFFIRRLPDMKYLLPPSFNAKQEEEISLLFHSKSNDATGAMCLPGDIADELMRLYDPGNSNYSLEKVHVSKVVKTIPGNN